MKKNLLNANGEEIDITSMQAINDIIIKRVFFVFFNGVVSVWCFNKY